LNNKDLIEGEHYRTNSSIKIIEKDMRKGILYTGGVDAKINLFEIK